jgi:hypothetical protein
VEPSGVPSSALHARQDAKTRGSVRLKDMLFDLSPSKDVEPSIYGSKKWEGAEARCFLRVLRSGRRLAISNRPGKFRL